MTTYSKHSGLQDAFLAILILQNRLVQNCAMQPLHHLYHRGDITVLYSTFQKSLLLALCPFIAPSEFVQREADSSKCKKHG